jgi:hypothetical protein
MKDKEPPPYTPRNLDEMRECIQRFMNMAPGGDTARFWNLITALRGPDTPCETTDMDQTQREIAYKARRQRKSGGVEVIRWHAFHGTVGGTARYRSDRDYIEVPPRKQHDHHDGHLVKAAEAIGLKVEYKENLKWRKTWSQIAPRFAPTGTVE